MEFDAGKWLGKCLFVPNTFRDLISYVKNEESLAAYAALMEPVTLSGNGAIPLEYEKEIRAKIIAVNAQSIVTGSERATVQMAVSAVTYIEGMLSEFLSCFFYYNPAAMHEYLVIGNNSGVVGLKIILDAGTKGEIVEQLSSLATDKVMQGKIDVVLKRLDGLVKAKVDGGLRSRLIALFEVRNKIIHEAAEPAVTVRQITSYFDDMHSLFLHLSLMTSRCGLKINDPAGLAR